MVKIAREMTRFSKKEIEQIFKKARRVVQQDGFTFLLAPRLKDFGRILIITSRKVGNAPVRNKLRRQLKSIFYEKKLYEQDWDWIILTKPESTKLSFSQLSDLIDQAVKKLA